MGNFKGYTEIKGTESIDEIYKIYKTSKNGLDKVEAEKRAYTYGLNLITSKNTSPIDIFLRQFKSYLILLLVIACGISFLFGTISDSITILAILFINTSISFFQEYKSEKTLEKLSVLISTMAEVRREGKEVSIDQKDIVPGDILIIKQGDIVPADCRLLESNEFSVDESILTGETIEKNKVADQDYNSNIQESKNFIFSGTTVVHGYCEALVISTGKNTRIGDIAKLTFETKKVSRYEKNISSFSKFLITVVFIGIIFLFFIRLFTYGNDVNFIDFLLFVLSLSISVVPEALPVITTVTMSIGAAKLSKKNVIVKRLSSLEDLGNIDVLCTDKTGTITENRLQIINTFAFDENIFFKYACLLIENPSSKRKKLSHSYDDSIRDYLIHKKLDCSEYQIVQRKPFDPKLKRRSVIAKNDKESLELFMGATEDLVKESDLDATHKNILIDKISAYGLQGKRSIGISIKENNNIKFIGYFIFEDPLKESAITAIEKAENLGLKIKILTGDSVEVAQYVGSEVGLMSKNDKVYSGDDIALMSDKKLRAVVTRYNVFARIDPEQKYRIIQQLQKIHNTVAYQGDGINDTPSLKLADVAIAVNTASDVAKEAADIVLLSNDLNVVITGIKYGRMVFCNIDKYIKHTMIGNFGMFFVICVLELLSSTLPLLPLQLLLSNLITDFPLLSISTDNVDTDSLKKPEKFNLSYLMSVSLILGIVYTFFSFMFIYLWNTINASSLQTALFIYFNLTSVIIIFSVRSNHFFFDSKKPSLLLTVSIFVVILLSLLLPYSFLSNIFHFSPLSIYELLLIIIFTALYFICLDTVKVEYNKLYVRLAEN